MIDLQMKKTSVVIPAYNEAAGIGNTLRELCTALPEDYSIIVIDDGSSDETGSIASGISDRIRVIRHEWNRGYGSAIKTACRFAEGDVIVWYDADGQHRPEDLISVVKMLDEKDLDYVIGVRSKGSHVDKNRRIGKKCFRGLLTSWLKNRCQM